MLPTPARRLRQSVCRMGWLARWSVMGRRDYNEALITVVKLTGVLQAFSGPARAPQARRLLNLDRVGEAPGWLPSSTAKCIAAAAFRPFGALAIDRMYSCRQPASCWNAWAHAHSVGFCALPPHAQKWFARAFTKGLKPAACAVAINSPGACIRAAADVVLCNCVKAKWQQTMLPLPAGSSSA